MYPTMKVRFSTQISGWNSTQENSYNFTNGANEKTLVISFQAMKTV